MNQQLHDQLMSSKNNTERLEVFRSAYAKLEKEHKILLRENKRLQSGKAFIQNIKNELEPQKLSNYKQNVMKEEIRATLASGFQKNPNANLVQRHANVVAFNIKNKVSQVKTNVQAFGETTSVFARAGAEATKKVAWEPLKGPLVQQTQKTSAQLKQMAKAFSLQRLKMEVAEKKNQIEKKVGVVSRAMTMAKDKVKHSIGNKFGKLVSEPVSNFYNNFKKEFQASKARIESQKVASVSSQQTARL